MRVLVLLMCLVVVLAQKKKKNENDVSDPSCLDCDVDQCPKPKGCVAGVVLDSCGCCEVCAKAEYELCDHPKIKLQKGIKYGQCGEEMECRLRTDLSPKEGPEALCYCLHEDVVCGSDDKTYNNLCQLMAAAARKNKKITVANKGLCKSAPVIVSPPTHSHNTTGDNVVLLCEAKGFPIPSIEWTWTRVDGKSIFLPSDDAQVSVNTRGGPEKWEVTGWLQIMEIERKHEGDYTCMVQNEYGVAQASARVKVEDDPRVVKDEI